MQLLGRVICTAVVAAATANIGFAQGSGANASTGSLGTSGGSTSSGSSGSTSGTGLGGTSLSTMQTAPSLALSTTTTTSTAISQSNGLGRFYANPYYLGTYANSINSSAQPGGFGTTLYPTTSGNGQIGFSGTGGGAGGGRGGAGGASGSVLTDPGGIMIPLPRQIAYPAKIHFAMTPEPPSKLLTELRGMIDRSTSIANPVGVQLEMDGKSVLIKGSVRDEDESKLVEGLIRLTPGVRFIKNDLVYPVTGP